MNNINIEQARENMIKQQIRTWEVLDERVLKLMAQTPRENYVPEQYQQLAYADTEIPLGFNEIMVMPSIAARLLQAVDCKPTDTVLEVGTGNGYLTALLASTARHVISVEIRADFSETAASNLKHNGIHNVTLEVGDAASGWKTHAPYDVIVISGSVPVLSENFQYSLKTGGRMVAVVGKSPTMEAILITRVGGNEWIHEYLFETDIPPLRNAPEPQHFSL